MPSIPVYNILHMFYCMMVAKIHKKIIRRKLQIYDIFGDPRNFITPNIPCITVLTVQEPNTGDHMYVHGNAS